MMFVKLLEDIRGGGRDVLRPQILRVAQAQHVAQMVVSSVDHSEQAEQSALYAGGLRLHQEHMHWRVVHRGNLLIHVGAITYEHPHDFG